MLNSIPGSALAVGIIVVIYSFICLFFGVLLAYLLVVYERRYSYVLFIILLISTSTLASIMQQIHYLVDWDSVTAGQFAIAQLAVMDSGAAISQGTSGFDRAVFWIQFYTYNANAALMMCWTTLLFLGTWRITPKLSLVGPLRNYLEELSIFCSLVISALLLGIAQVPKIASDTITFAILCNTSLIVSCTVGAVFLILTLWKFVDARRFLNGSTFSSNNRSHKGTATSGEQDNQGRRTQRNIDRAIITRVSIAFTFLSVFNICNIVFQVRSLSSAYGQNARLSDYTSTSAAITHVVLFLPGVTCGLISWAIWGTTKQFRQVQHNLLRSMLCCSRRSRSSSQSSGNELERNSTVGLRESGLNNFERLNSLTRPREGQIHIATELTFFESRSDESDHDIERINKPSVIISSSSH